MDGKILLISPPSKYQHRQQVIPLGLLNIATILSIAGFDVKFIDITAEKPYDITFLSEPLNPKEFIQFLNKYDPEVIGITSSTENHPLAMQIVRMCKNENPNLKVIYGGIHATFQAVESLVNNPDINLVVVGEAEHVIKDIVENLIKSDDFSNISNLVYRENNLIKHSNINTVPDLNAIPLPDFEFIKDKYYPSQSLPIEFSRGCPFQCAFCCLSTFAERNVRFFPVARVVDILESYKEIFKNFSFAVNDSSFLFNHKRVRQLLAEISHRKLELNNWFFQTRVDTVTRDILRELHKFNLNTISLGIEDIHDSVLKKIKKKQTFNQIERAVKEIKELGILTHSNFIIGLPSQTKNHMLENIQYSHNLDLFIFPCITPFPGSPIYVSPKKFGLTILSNDWELYRLREILVDSVVFPVQQQMEIRDLAWRHCAKMYLEKESTFFFLRKEYERLLELGFDIWYDQWKNTHLTGWN